ncbi:MAG: sigma-70 family RNA polymerase sigma factor [Spirochaetia bacterium]|nr:sigma-70 family RNA polymerase sigma factor [Spirochaetia bacterium]
MKQGLLDVRDLESLYQAHKAEVLRYLTSLTHDLDDAHDLFQAVFMRLIKHVEAGKVRSETARAYIFRMAHNLFVDAYRRRKSENRAFEHHAEVAPAFSELESPRIDIQEAFLALAESGELTDRQADVLRLRFLSMQEVEDIARTLDMGTHTVYREIRAILAAAHSRFIGLGLSLDDFQEVRDS